MKSFIKLWISQSSAKLGDALYTISIVSLLYSKTKSASIAAFFPAIRVTMGLLSNFFVPLFYKKIGLHNVLLFSQLSQVTILIFLLGYAEVNSTSVIIMMLLLAPLAFFEGIISPSRSAYLPRLVVNEKLMLANSSIGITDQIVLFIGYTFGGVMIGYWGMEKPLYITVIAWFVSAIAISMIEKKDKAIAIDQPELTLEKLLSGWVFVWNNTLYRSLFFIEVLESFAASVWTGATLFILLKTVLHADKSWYGYLNGAYLLGGALGGLISVLVYKRFNKILSRILVFDSLNRGILTLFFSYISYPILSLFVGSTMGITHQMRIGSQNTLMQNYAPKEELANIYAVHKIIRTLAFALGASVMGFLADSYPIHVVYITAGISLLISSIVSWVTLARRSNYAIST